MEIIPPLEPVRRRAAENHGRESKRNSPLLSRRPDQGRDLQPQQVSSSAKSATIEPQDSCDRSDQPNPRKRHVVVLIDESRSHELDAAEFCKQPAIGHKAESKEANRRITAR